MANFFIGLLVGVIVGVVGLSVIAIIYDNDKKA